jgi:hypothetical protein
MMGAMTNREALKEIVDQIDVARNMVLDFEVRLLRGEDLDGYESMRIECDRVLRGAALRVLELAGPG